MVREKENLSNTHTHTQTMSLDPQVTLSPLKPGRLNYKLANTCMPFHLVNKYPVHLYKYCGGPLLLR